MSKDEPKVEVVEPTEEQKAKRVLTKEREERQQKCIKEVEEVLKKNNCAINPFALILENGTVGANVSIVANEK